MSFLRISYFFNRDNITPIECIEKFLKLCLTSPDLKDARAKRLYQPDILLLSPIKSFFL